ncbi:hypothetical protein JUJ52_12950 [Virgibacillus sp. AGTR]|nr:MULTISPECIES: hypothetical protein [Bacillaceae]MCC2250869.1 hypothetical protein [Virgibacillus sp. AGTR]
MYSLRWIQKQSTPHAEEQIQLVNRRSTAVNKGCAIGNILKKKDVQIDYV